MRIGRALVWLCLAASLALAAPPAHALTLKDAGGLHVLSQQALDQRLLAIALSTPALDRPVNVRVLLPSGYAHHPQRRYPVLYLFDGTSGHAFDWTRMGDAEKTTAGKPLIVVMPDISINGDGGGWCTNWWNGGARGRPEWERFHISELIPWIDRNLRTRRSRAGRAVAGLSQGGFCSTSYAARHPDLFGIALSFSGAPDIAYDPEAQTLVTPVINATETYLDHAPANSMFGPRNSEEINWAAHDPTTLAGNLRYTHLFLYTGNGHPGPLDHNVNLEAMGVEAGVEQLTQLFHRRLDSLGIPSFYDDYGPGTHSWPYWARDLRQSIDAVMRDFSHPLIPRQVTYMSADRTYRAYGWRVRMKRAVWEFSTLQHASRAGFTLQGSGRATVTTPPVYTPGRRYEVKLRWRGGTRTIVARGSRGRRLIISVPLGPSNTVQEYPMDGPPVGTTVYTGRVTIGSGS